MVTYSKTTSNTCERAGGWISKVSSDIHYSSAAFNLNHPIIDDLAPGEDGHPRKLTDQMEIGRRGIELAVLGGFEKCTWDGASDTYPSKCRY